MSKVKWSGRYVPSGDVVAREIEGEMIIIPLVGGIGDLEDEIYTLNETGRSIWKGLDGQSTLQELVLRLTETFDGPEERMREEVAGFVEELLRMGMVVEKT